MKREVDHNGSKRCTGKHGCGQVKPLSEFKFLKIGERYSGSCTQCIYADQRASRKRRQRSGWVHGTLRFTPERVEELRRHIERGMTAEQAASAMGESVRAIIWQRGNHHLPRFKAKAAYQRRPSKYDEQRLAEIACAIHAGGSSARVASKLGTTRNAILGAIHRNRKTFNELLQRCRAGT